MLSYDQNHEYFAKCVEAIYEHEALTGSYAGTAFHWHASIYDVLLEQPRYSHKKGFLR